MERVADAELQVRAVDGADFHLDEQALAMFQTEQDVEPAAEIRRVTADHVIQRGARAGIDMPSLARWKHVGKLQVERHQRHVVADADFNIRTESQAIDKRRRLHVPAEIELIRVDGHTGANTRARLRIGGIRAERRGQHDQTHAQRDSRKTHVGNLRAGLFKTHAAAVSLTTAQSGVSVALYGLCPSPLNPDFVMLLTNFAPWSSAIAAPF